MNSIIRHLTVYFATCVHKVTFVLYCIGREALRRAGLSAAARLLYSIDC